MVVISEGCLVLPLLVAELGRYARNLRKTTMHFGNLVWTADPSKRMPDTALIGYRVWQVLCTILGKTISTLT